MDFSEYAVPALHLVAATDESGFSKIGGLPNLPEDIAWPSWKESSLAFLCQIAMAELPADAPVRLILGEGCLYFFYDQEQSSWGFDPEDAGSWRVIHSKLPPSPDVRAAPEDLGDDCLYAEKWLRFQPIASLPDGERLEPHLTAADDAAMERMLDDLDEQKHALYGGEPHHQIGGYPDVVQNDGMELECQLASHGLFCGDSSGYEDPRAADLEAGAADWGLLLQLDTDDDTGMMWGDCGMLYFWIREADLAAGDLDKCWMILQCS